MKTIEEKNRMIAEFMGVSINESNRYFELPQHGFMTANMEFKTEFSNGQLKYHTSWDWLMPVVITIHDKININCMRLNMEDCHNTIVKFIEWYNNNK